MSTNSASCPIACQGFLTPTAIATLSPMNWTLRNAVTSR
jgi:hypothetical protein